MWLSDINMSVSVWRDVAWRQGCFLSVCPQLQGVRSGQGVSSQLWHGTDASFSDEYQLHCTILDSNTSVKL